MYSNEAKSERFLPVQLGVYPKVDGQPRWVLDAGPNVFVLYPEYLTDPLIIFCPSDAELGTSIAKAHLNDDVNQDWCIGYAHNSGGRCARSIDSSYGYVSWVLDKANCNDPMTTVGALPNLNAVISSGSLGQVQVDLNTQVTTQVGSAFAYIFGVALSLLTNPNPPMGIYPDIDKDISVAPGVGNGGSSTIYRLREGIERFLITDINNPSASAQAQSSVWIMFDQLSTNPAAYNHIPGGSNVLYMDGHVQFLRYGECEPAPVNKPMALLVGILTSS